MSAPRAAWLGWIEGARRRLRKRDIQASLVVERLVGSFVTPPEGVEPPRAPEPHVVAVIAELGGFAPPWSAS